MIWSRLTALTLLAWSVVATHAVSTSGTRETRALIEPYSIHIPDESLTQLLAKLALATFPDDLEQQPYEWERGTSVRYLRELIDYWRVANASRPHYDWRAREREWNKLPHFRTRLNGYDLHFIHARSPRPDAVPLLFSHGWPGSFLECLKVLPELVHPSDSAAPAFHVVCPSIPGFAFSPMPPGERTDVWRVAELFVALMERLNYSQYVAQGGDWGALITSHMCTIDAERCIGLHINMVPTAPPLNLFRTRNPISAMWTTLNTLLDFAVPMLRFRPEEAEMVEAPLQWLWDQTVSGSWTQRTGQIPMRRGWLANALSLITPSCCRCFALFSSLLFVQAYFHQQSTRPDTVGLALHDSPVGLASWLVEKYRMWSDCAGDVESVWSKDDLLDHIALYHLTNTITTSMRLYYHTAHPVGDSMLTRLQSWDVKVPTAVAMFPAELGRAPRKWLEHYFNIQVSHTATVTLTEATCAHAVVCRCFAWLTAMCLRLCVTVVVLAIHADASWRSFCRPGAARPLAGRRTRLRTTACAVQLQTTRRLTVSESREKRIIKLRWKLPLPFPFQFKFQRYKLKKEC